MRASITIYEEGFRPDRKGISVFMEMLCDLRNFQQLFTGHGRVGKVSSATAMDFMLRESRYKLQATFWHLARKTPNCIMKSAISCLCCNNTEIESMAGKAP